jgi:putative FmdB family regulatory protein
MPLYEYQCEQCGKRFEVIQRFSDAAIETCKNCGGGPVHKLISAPAIQFKGTGWYITDYAKKNGSSPAPSSNTSATSESATSSTSETKAETKVEKKADTRTDSKTSG